MEEFDSPPKYDLLEAPLQELLLALEARHESARIKVNTPRGFGSIEINKGLLQGASFGVEEGVGALSNLLSEQKGSYEIGDLRHVNSQGLGRVPSLSQLVRANERTRGATGSPLGLRLTTSLSRSSALVQGSLSAAQQEILRHVDGRRTSLKVIELATYPASITLSALRQLVKAGLVVEGAGISVSRTISMGTGDPGLKRATPSAASAANTVPRKKSDPPAGGQWGKGRSERKLNATGYSSIPPAALAEEQITFPKSLKHAPPPDFGEKARARTSSAAQKPAASRGTSDQIHPLHAEPIAPVAASSKPFIRKDTPTALSAAIVRGDEPEEDTPVPRAQYHLRDSEIPVPSSRLDAESLELLDELNSALRSSSRPLSLDEFGQDESEPSGTGFDLPPDELPAPGSVPLSTELPGNLRRSEETSLPRVGRYEVLARLKRGGMGSVYMCRLSGTAGFRRLFAMKVLHGHLAVQSDALEAFFHEARVLGGLHHPNIVAIADVGTPTEPYIVMDYVEGGSLAELYRGTESGRDPALVISIILDALSGLHYAHTAADENGDPLSLVHCDVTPHNLLVGIDGTCRVTDFGIARTRRDGGSNEQIQGKPGYLAPERLQKSDSDHRSDIFSLGVVLYAGLTGVEPFRGASTDESMRLILKGNPLPPSEVGFRPPPALDWVCMKALAVDPSARFSSADEMATQLRRIAEREGLIASTHQVGKWVRSSIAGTLAARRAASMRGTRVTDAPPAVETIPPPPVETAERAPLSEAPSALETTGPLEPPPPSSAEFGDRTEIISSTMGTTEPAARKKYLTYAVVLAALALALWVVLKPKAFTKLFKVDTNNQPAPALVSPAPHPLPAESPASSKQTRPASPDKAVRFDENGKVILPEFDGAKDEE